MKKSGQTKGKLLKCNKMSGILLYNAAWKSEEMCAQIDKLLHLISNCNVL